jgi:hypothetical protein
MGNVLKAKPIKVVLALRIMWALWAFGLIKFLASIFFYNTISSVIPKEKLLLTAFGNFIIISLLWLIVYSASKGKNWARLIFAIFVCISTALSLRSLIVIPQPPLSMFLSMGMFGFQALILWLLFHRESATWFKSEFSRE